MFHRQIKSGLSAESFIELAKRAIDLPFFANVIA